jgi:hypothetical protein
MSDPIYAMNILQRRKWRLLNRNLVRRELRAAGQHDYSDVAYPIDSQFASDAGASSPRTARRLVGIALS